ncbi:MAG: serine hydrolase, partial [Nitratireductor sp.]
MVVLAAFVLAPAHASKYAAIVIDANTGKTLHAANADAPRYPASLTKMMTLYMVFEAMEAGKVNKNTRIPFSKHAAARPPTKLGVRAGGSISLETAIYALVTKSANDASAALAEYFGGTESGFARKMTAKARQLGMTKTTFRNASGLPNSAQKTTARDMAVL